MYTVCLHLLAAFPFTIFVLYFVKKCIWRQFTILKHLSFNIQVKRL